jgi:hypothetical protein
VSVRAGPTDRSKDGPKTSAGKVGVRPGSGTHPHADRPHHYCGGPDQQPTPILAAGSATFASRPSSRWLGSEAGRHHPAAARFIGHGSVCVIDPTRGRHDVTLVEADHHPVIPSERALRRRQSMEGPGVIRVVPPGPWRITTPVLARHGRQQAPAAVDMDRRLRRVSRARRAPRQHRHREDRGADCKQ